MAFPANQVFCNIPERAHSITYVPIRHVYDLQNLTVIIVGIYVDIYYFNPRNFIRIDETLAILTEWMSWIEISKPKYIMTSH